MSTTHANIGIEDTKQLQLRTKSEVIWIDPAEARG